MIKNLFIPLVLAWCIMLTGCGNKHIDNEALEDEFENAPEWVLIGHEKGIFSAVGSARIGKSGMQFAKTAALAQARNELARQLSVKVESLVNNFVLQTGLEVELTDHLGYEAHDPVCRGSGNTRNGYTPKTVTTEIGPVELRVPRDRTGTFEPVTVLNHQRRLDGLSGNVISLYAKRLTTAGVSAPGKLTRASPTLTAASSGPPVEV